MPNSEIQAVLFDKNLWNQSQAMIWLKKHHISPLKKVHVTKRFLRYRINDPKQYKRLRTDKLAHFGIDLIIGFK